MPSKDTLAVVQNLGLTENQEKDGLTMIKAIQRYADGHICMRWWKDRTFDSEHSNRRVFDKFLTSLRKLAKDASLAETAACKNASTTG